jgi:hypothetical protein
VGLTVDWTSFGAPAFRVQVLKVGLARRGRVLPSLQGADDRDALPAAQSQNQPNEKALAIVLAALAVLGIWTPFGWWPALAIVGSILSLALMVLFFGPTKLLPLAVALGIAWCGTLAIVLPTGIPASEADVSCLLPLVFVAMVAGPIIFSLALTGLFDGKSGYRDVAARRVRWRVEPLWYAASLIAPLLLLAILGALSLASPAFLRGFSPRGTKASS